MVSPDTRHQAIGLRLIDVARSSPAGGLGMATRADFDDDLRPFYIDAAGFTPTNGGRINLIDPD